MGACVRVCVREWVCACISEFVCVYVFVCGSEGVSVYGCDGTGCGAEGICCEDGSVCQFCECMCEYECNSWCLMVGMSIGRFKKHKS